MKCGRPVRRLLLEAKGRKAYCMNLFMQWASSFNTIEDPCLCQRKKGRQRKQVMVEEGTQ